MPASFEDLGVLIRLKGSYLDNGKPKPKILNPKTPKYETPNPDPDLRLLTNKIGTVGFTQRWDFAYHGFEQPPYIPGSPKPRGTIWAVPIIRIIMFGVPFFLETTTSDHVDVLK